MAIVSGIIAAVGVAGSLVSGAKAKKASKRANASQRAINRLKNKQAKRAFLRQFRQAQAAALVGGVASGVDIASSGVQGTLSSQTSQGITAVSEFKQADDLGAEMTRQLSKQVSANFSASVFGSVASFATSAGGADFLDSIGKN